MTTPYDRANQILTEHLPAMGAANEILGKAFPFLAAANRTLAASGVPSRGAYLPPRAADLPAGSVSGPHRAPPGLAAKLIAKDAAGGAAVNINVWAAHLQTAGIATETIRAAYDAAGGDAVLAPAEQSGNTAGFLGDFVQGLEDRGAPPEIILGAYQQSGGQLA